MMNDNASVVGKLILRGKLLLKTPLLIGSGDKSDYVDIVTLKDPDGIPYIPATSLTGVLRHYFTENVASPEAKEDYRLFWGCSLSNTDSVQSALFIRDLTTQDEPKIIVRDGVRINSLGIVDEGMKYDFEVIEPGIGFDLYLEVTLRKHFDKIVFKNIFAYLVQVLRSGGLAVGAMTTKGLGSIELAKGYDCREFDFTRKLDVIAWLASDFTVGQQLEVPKEWVFPPNNQDLTAEIDLAIVNSLIIRQYVPTGDADAIHLGSNGQPIISGTSLKGALKNRAKRIVGTLGGEINLLDGLFGPLKREEEEAKQKRIRSRVLVNEPIIYNATAKDQTRVKVDRFTGGAIDGALFTTRPLWSSNGKNKMTTIKVTIKNYQDWEVGLLLLLVKDLWTSDLPVGGEKSIGRGTFTGIKAKIMLGGKLIEISEQDGNLILSGASPEDLQKYVDALVAKCGEGAVICSQ